MTNNSRKVYKLGQSLWYDNIQRSLLENGELEGMIADGTIYGVTSNPSIFNKAIAKSNDYDDDMFTLADAGKKPLEIYEALAVKDIQAACDLFTDVYQLTNAKDGYVSLEVNPNLANNTEETYKEAKRLFELVNRPNLMIKIPATKAGLPAIQKAISEGINVNVTLIFSRSRYVEVMEAYLSGLEMRHANSLPIDRIASVASFFVSRIDAKVDDQLNEMDNPRAEELKGKIAIANAKSAYQLFLEFFGSQRFKAIKAHGAVMQRPLWASTSTKNPAYSDVLYVNELIGAETVNTVPPKTLQAFLDHGEPAVTIANDLPAVEKNLASLQSLGISLDQATQELEDAGVAAFAQAFAQLLESIEVRVAKR